MIARDVEFCHKGVNAAGRSELGALRLGREIRRSGEAGHEGMAVRVDRDLHPPLLPGAAEKGRIHQYGINDQRPGRVISRDLETDLALTYERVTACDLLFHAGLLLVDDRLAH